VPTAGHEPAAGPERGDQAPEIALEQLLQAPDGTKVTWESLKGKVVVLEFWATWCTPCVASIPHMNELAETFKDKPVQFIAITEEDENQMRKFLAKKPIRAWIGLDTDESVFRAYGVKGIPHTVVVDKSGRIATITYPSALTSQLLNDVLAGRKPTVPPRGDGQPGRSR
jgi:thiol-disulfide isomerase/thioredoxin